MYNLDDLDVEITSSECNLFKPGTTLKFKDANKLFEQREEEIKKRNLKKTDSVMTFKEWQGNLNNDIQYERLESVGASDKEIQKIHEEEYSKYISKVKKHELPYEKVTGRIITPSPYNEKIPFRYDVGGGDASNLKEYCKNYLQKSLLAGDYEERNSLSNYFNPPATKLRNNVDFRKIDDISRLSTTDRIRSNITFNNELKMKDLYNEIDKAEISLKEKYRYDDNYKSIKDNYIGDNVYATDGKLDYKTNNLEYEIYYDQRESEKPDNEEMSKEIDKNSKNITKEFKKFMLTAYMLNETDLIKSVDNDNKIESTAEMTVSAIKDIDEVSKTVYADFEKKAPDIVKETVQAIENKTNFNKDEIKQIDSSKGNTHVFELSNKDNQNRFFIGNTSPKGIKKLNDFSSKEKTMKIFHELKSFEKFAALKNENKLKKSSINRLDLQH
jgi:hypothetical protein